MSTCRACLCQIFPQNSVCIDINVSFERGEAGEAGWMKYFTDVVPQFNNAVEV